MATKYARARDTAFQWRSEYAKLKKENRSLRSVYKHAKAMSEHLAGGDGTKSLDQLARSLRDALKNAVFAVGGE